MWRNRNPATVGILLTALLVAVALATSCGYSGDRQATQDAIDRSACSGCTPALSSAQIAVVRQTFPEFQPEEFGEGTGPNSENLIPSNFAPAQFWGPPSGSATAARTPLLHIPVQANGFDGLQVPAVFPQPQGVYFNRSLQEVPFSLTTFERSPLNLLQQRLGVAVTPHAPTVAINLNDWRVDLGKIDEDMAFIQQQLALEIPAIAQVNPANAQIIIEPSIFYASGTNFGNTWAGGLTTALSQGAYTIQLANFYIYFSSQGNMLIVNWEDYLVDEAINFYVLSVGREDLARVAPVKRAPKR